MSVVIVDVGIANLGSICRVLEEFESRTVIAKEPTQLEGASKVILPGVGNFRTAMQRLNETGLTEAIKQVADDGIPVLGICLGMQLLASTGFESGESAGLDLVPGSVISLSDEGSTERIPHMGWNDISIRQSDRLVDGIADGTDFYFVHSYVFVPKKTEHVFATCRHGIDFACIVGKDNVMGTQFHPEKSSKAGLRVLRNFIGIA